MRNKDRQEQKSSGFFRKFAHMVLFLGLTLSFLVILLSIYRISSLAESSASLKYYQSILLISIISTSLFGLALKLRVPLRINVALMVVSSTIPVLVSEIYLTFKPNYSSKEENTLGDLDDKRSKIQVVKDFRAIGVDAYPNISGSQFVSTNGLPLAGPQQRIYPLGAISNKKTVYCNESGQWSIFESDEHGFNNPVGLYQKNKVDIVLTGDSFAEGACVHPDETIASVLREFDFNVISLGKGGNGSLLELASLIEYAKPIQPKVVLWVHYANDLDDLTKKGMQSPMLLRYLNDDEFSQNLIEKQDTVDRLLKAYIDREYQELTLEDNPTRIENHLINTSNRKKRDPEKLEEDNVDKLPEEFSTSQFIEILKLTRLREELGLRPPRPSPKSSTDEAFQNILKKAKNTVAGYGGHIYLVYLHAFERYETGREHDIYFRDFVLQTASHLNIPIIDIHKDVFSSYDAPLSLFPGRKARHYNAAGYRLVAKEIAERLSSDPWFH